VQAEAPSLAVMAQAYYPAWKATVNGVPTPLLRANHAFQAVALAAGTQHVVLTYEDSAFRLGLWLSLLSLLIRGVA